MEFKKCYLEKDVWFQQSLKEKKFWKPQTHGFVR